jgi:arylsulfatase A-like enzyme
MLREIRDSAERRANDPENPARTVAALRRLPFVADAYTHAQLLSADKATPADSFVVLERRSLYPGRFAAEFSPFGVEYRLVEGWSGGPRGTGHGSPYWYDRHVPLLFMGPGFAAGRDSTRAATVDFAPTLARAIGLPVPKNLDGRALGSVGGR